MTLLPRIRKIRRSMDSMGMSCCGRFECDVSLAVFSFYHKGSAKAVKETYPLEIAICDFKFPKQGVERIRVQSRSWFYGLFNANYFPAAG
jgi:hypothetical protein